MAIITGVERNRQGWWLLYRNADGGKDLGV